MLHVTNISIIPAAAILLRQERERFQPRRGKIFALVYISSFTNRDGSMVEGFRPGYKAMAWDTEYLGENWVLAHLHDGTEFSFFPMGKWDSRAHYVVSLTGSQYAPFSIAPHR